MSLEQWSLRPPNIRHFKRKTTPELRVEESLCNAGARKDLQTVFQLQGASEVEMVVYKGRLSTLRKTLTDRLHTAHYQTHHCSLRSFTLFRLFKNRRKPNKMCTRTKFNCGCSGQTTRCGNKACKKPTQVKSEIACSDQCAAWRASIATASSSTAKKPAKNPSAKKTPAAKKMKNKKK